MASGLDSGVGLLPPAPLEARSARNSDTQWKIRTYGRTRAVRVRILANDGIYGVYGLTCPSRRTSSGGCYNRPDRARRAGCRLARVGVATSGREDTDHGSGVSRLGERGFGCVRGLPRKAEGGGGRLGLAHPDPLL